MLDHPFFNSQPMRIQTCLCPHGNGYVYLHAGDVCLSFSDKEFLQLAQIVRDTARELQAWILSQGWRADARARQEVSSCSLFPPRDPAMQLTSVLTLLRTETEPARIDELRRQATALDEEVRQEVRQYARERAARA